MIYNRSILPSLENHLSEPEITVLTGMRRSGKTTLLRYLFEKIDGNKAIFDLENPIERQIFSEKDYNNIWGNLKSYGISSDKKAVLFLDEIQSYPEIVHPIKYLYDHYSVKFIVTGSSSFYLKNHFPESLAGRKMIFELFPLDFNEFLTFRGIERIPAAGLSDVAINKNRITAERLHPLFNEYLAYGGFPQIVLENDNGKKKAILNDIFTSYFEKDVKVLGDFRNISAFQDLMLLLLQRTGSRLDVTRLSSETGVSRETVYSYLSFLEGSYFCSFIKPFTANRDREVSGTRKVYCCDNGFVNLFAKVSDGALFENACFHSLRRFGELKYYQKRSGAEIDFVLPSLQTGVEIKMRATNRDVERLAKISGSLGLKEFFVLTKEFSEEGKCVPASGV